MAARVLVPGQETETFDIDIEASDQEGTYRVEGPGVEAFKQHIHLKGGGWAHSRFDVSCDLGTLRECSMDGDMQAQIAILTCSNVEPPAPAG